MRHAVEPHWPWLSRRFATTRWTLLQRVAVSEAIANPSTAELCRLYWHPLYAFLRSRGHGEAECQDHVQSFLTRVLRDGLVNKANANVGRFRSYLITMLIRHVSTAQTRASVQKRGGGIRDIPVDWSDAESLYLKDAALATSPEDTFRRSLAVRLIEDAMSALRRRYEGSGQLALFEEIFPALEGPLVDASYSDIAVRLGVNPGAVRVAVVRMRARFRENLRSAASVALNVTAGPLLDDELREIFG